MSLEEIKSLILADHPESVVGEDLDATPPALLIDPNHLLEVCEKLHAHEKTYFDLLSCITAIDKGVEAGTMEVVYNLYSIPYDHKLMIKVQLDRSKPEIDSVNKVWKAADWHEREAYDLLGVKFRGHPDLRRILLPEDWEGYPLRKDYEAQETYHEVKVKY